MDLDKEIGVFELHENEMTGFAGNHLNNAFAVFKMLNKIEIEFNKLVQPDPRTGQLVIESQAYWDFIDKFWKPIRYMLDLQAPAWNAKFRTWTFVDKVDGRGKVDRKVVTDTDTLRNLMFGKALQDMDMYGYEMETGDKIPVYDKDKRRNKSIREMEDEARSKTGMSRNVLAYIIAEQIRLHRQWPGEARGGSFKHYGIEEIRFLRALFNSMTRSVAINGEDVKVLRDFFSEDEWDRILKVGVLGNSNTIMRHLFWFNSPWWRLYFGAYGGDIGAGGVVDLSKAILGPLMQLLFSGLKIGG